ncbi:hypothetical protein [Actinoallomurus bryophytorum]|nr:hypothetical protein [Actinoallomurus bryophytorum]
MARSWWASCQAGFVSIGGFFAVIIAAAVTYRSSALVTTATLGGLVVGFTAVAAYEWWAGRRLGTELSRLQLIVVAAGLVFWQLYQTSPGGLPYDPTSAQLCAYIQRLDRPCLIEADAARLHSDIAWWSTGIIIVILGLMARRSRTAAWIAPAVAIAGGAVALHFLDVFVRPAAAAGLLPAGAAP